MPTDSLWLFIILTDLNDKNPLGTAHIQTTIGELKGEIH